MRKGNRHSIYDLLESLLTAQRSHYIQLKMMEDGPLEGIIKFGEAQCILIFNKANVLQLEALEQSAP